MTAKTKKKPKMRTVWHVYIDNDEDDRKDFDFRAEWPGLEDPDKRDDLPFSDRLWAMKLFRTRAGAEKYIDELAGRIRDFFVKKNTVRYFYGWAKMIGTPEIIKLEAYDGGQFDRRVIIRSVRKDGKPGKKILHYAWIKAVLREVGR